MPAATTPPTPKIGAIVFSVKNIEKAQAFYRDALGLQTTVRGDPHATDHANEQFMIAQAGDVTLVFFKRNDKPGKSPVVVFNLPDGGIDRVAAELGRRGVQMVTGVTESPGGWSVDFLDTDGHMLAYYQEESKPR